MWLCAGLAACVCACMRATFCAYVSMLVLVCACVCMSVGSLCNLGLVKAILGVLGVFFIIRLHSVLSYPHVEVYNVPHVNHIQTLTSLHNKAVGMDGLFKNLPAC